MPCQQKKYTRRKQQLIFYTFLKKDAFILFDDMKKKTDILGIEDVRLLVDNFYGKVREDSLLGPVFETVIEHRWPQHLEKMYRFWQTVLFGERTYSGAPFPPHAPLPIGAAHFERWLQIFRENTDSLFEGEKSEEAKWRAEKMAIMFQMKIEHLHSTNIIPLV